MTPWFDILLASIVQGVGFVLGAAGAWVVCWAAVDLTDRLRNPAPRPRVWRRGR